MTRHALTILGTVAGMLALAPAAHAGTIRYTIPETPAYTVQDNGNGIVKVTYNGCVTAGERQTLAFALAVNVTNADGNATFNVLKEEGGAPTTVFTPPSVLLQRGGEQRFDVSLAFSVDEANNGVTAFRVKLDPDSGEGLGEGAGIAVRIPCVLAAGQTSGYTQQPGRTADGQAVPTAGFLPATTSPLARSSAPCVSTPRRLRLRANETTTVVVRIARGEDRLARSLVRVTFPGGSRTARTGADGTVRLRIRPRRAGTLVVQSEACFGADRVRVLGARVTGGGRPARFTG